MKVRLAPELFKISENVREAILVVSNIDNTYHADHSYQYLCHEMDNIRKDFTQYTHKGEEISQDAWQGIFNDQLGFDEKKVRPSHVALMSRVIVDRADLPNINPLVNVINAIQLVHKIPIGAHDLDKIDGDITVGKNSKGLEFLPRDENSSLPVDIDEIVHADNNNVVTRKWCWRQGRKDICSDQSSNVIFFLNSLDQSQDLEQVAADLTNALRQFTGNKEVTCKFAILSKDSPEAETEELQPFTPKEEKVADIQTREISRDPQLIENVLDKATEEVLPSREALEKLLLSGRRIRVYQGFDPTADTLHIGHTVSMRRLEAFRQLGHEVIFLIGDFTARIGDPDKSSARQQLTADQVNENLRKYKEQASAIVDIDNEENPVTVLFNNDWLGKMTFEDVIKLSSNFTVQQMMKRELFAKRLEEGTPLYIHEFMYPLMQGWDAVHMEVDIEIGGNDQLFNMMAGRDLVNTFLGKDKIVVTGKLLTTDDGSKMGKTTNNMVKLSDTSQDIYGKIMATSDSSIADGFEALTNYTMDQVKEIKEQLESGTNPIKLKKKLAFTLTRELRGEEEAEKAQRYFEEVYQKKSYETDLEVVQVAAGEYQILALLSEHVDTDRSKGELRRLIQQGAVKLNDEKVTKIDQTVNISQGDLIKLGKRVVKIG